MTILGDGKVGIGTTTPPEALTVEGNISGSGNLILPNQPSFLAHNSATDVDIPADTDVSMSFDTVIFDPGNDFDESANNWIFTAPVNGRYFLKATLQLQTIDTVASFYTFKMITSNREYRRIFDPTEYADDLTNLPIEISCVADMDASDTAYVTIYQGSGASQTDIFGHADFVYTYFCGYLLGGT